MPIRAEYVHTNLIARDWKDWLDSLPRSSDASPGLRNATCLAPGWIS